MTDGLEHTCRARSETTLLAMSVNVTQSLTRTPPPIGDISSVKQNGRASNMRRNYITRLTGYQLQGSWRRGFTHPPRATPGLLPKRVAIAPRQGASHTRHGAALARLAQAGQADPQPSSESSQSRQRFLHAAPPIATTPRLYPTRHGTQKERQLDMRRLQKAAAHGPQHISPAKTNPPKGGGNNNAPGQPTDGAKCPSNACGRPWDQNWRAPAAGHRPASKGCEPMEERDEPIRPAGINVRDHHRR